MNKIYLIPLFLVGLINFIPVLGVISLEKVNQLYGLSANDQNLAILLRHRALLFGLIGGVILFSVFNAQYQVLAMILAAVSMIGYMVLYYFSAEPNQELATVFKVDVLGVVLLFIAITLKYITRDL